MMHSSIVSTTASGSSNGTNNINFSNTDEINITINDNNNMNQGEILRKLRQLELQDEAERRPNKIDTQQQQQQQQQQQEEEEQDESVIRHQNRNDNEEIENETADTEIIESKHVLLSSGKKVLFYDSYLYHQRYYDDLKHIDYNYIDYTIPPTTIISSSCHQEEKINDACSQSTTAMMTTTINKIISPSPSLNILILQDKLLGKGGFCWDAAFILGEYILHTLLYTNKNDNIPASVIINDSNQQQRQQKRNYRIVELGAGTGLCSILLAKGLLQHSIQQQQQQSSSSSDRRNNNNNNNNNNQYSYDITVTDLGKVIPLLQQNVTMNFNKNSCFETHVQEEQEKNSDTNLYSGSFVDYQEHLSSKSNTGTNKTLSSSSSKSLSSSLVNNDNTGTVNIHVSELEWGCLEQEEQHGTFDIIVGADVVASIYDPILLAQTIYKLCDSKNTIVYISFKERLSTIHRQFEKEMYTLFTTITILQPPFYYDNSNSSTTMLDDITTATNKIPIPIPMRNCNPAVHILIASGVKK